MKYISTATTNKKYKMLVLVRDNRYVYHFFSIILLHTLVEKSDSKGFYFYFHPFFNFF